MPLVRADTDATLDKCAECGGLPGVEESKQDGDTVYRARCTDCHNVAAWAYCKYDTTVAWNLEQRDKKREKERKK